MRVVATSILTAFIACAAAAQLTPGVIVRSGEPFPIVADFNGDGFDDLVQKRTVLLNHDGDLSDRQDLGLPSSERGRSATERSTAGRRFAFRRTRRSSRSIACCRPTSITTAVRIS